MWAGCEKYLVRALQVLHNQAAMAVTGKSWFTAVRRLLKDCNWLSVNQPMFYTTVLQVHKVVNKDRPVYFQQRMSTMHPYQTRQAAGSDIWHGEEFPGSKRFFSRGALAYNSVPSHNRNARSLQIFKYKLKQWVSTNVPID